MGVLLGSFVKRHSVAHLVDVRRLENWYSLGGALFSPPLIWFTVEDVSFVASSNRFRNYLLSILVSQERSYRAHP